MKFPFTNEPLTDFGKADNVAAFRCGLDKVCAGLGRSYPLVIGGEKIFTDETFPSLNPANPGQVVGKMAKGTPELAQRAVAAAAGAFLEWRRVPYEERARYLFSAAKLMRARKHEFSALMVLEVGKTWDEADADTAEAIDFMEFYGREMLRLGAPQATVTGPDREAELSYIPLGVGIVIPPWNFPAAIMTGMTAATIVSGNTAVLKPASSSPVIAAWLVELFNDQLHLPPGVLNFLPGPGGAIGDALVDHPQTRFVAFTGSKEVGLRIFQRAAQVQPGQKWLKRTILEMGGKDSILVDETADLDEAADGIVRSAFGFGGQKCSACSRVVAVAEIYEPLLQRVTARAQQIRVGDPLEGPEVGMGPVVEASALKKHLDYIQVGKDEGRLVLGGDPIATSAGGYFLQPTIIADVPPDGRLAQEEVFGPVLAVIKARDFDEGLAIANNTEYGLTGSIYSMRRDRLERARREFHVGNLYFNRKCTGAAVGQEPFGGFNMSGTDSKAGGQDYLLLFTQAKVSSEMSFGKPAPCQGGL
ncbi:MAG TPA: L-glutamate gamma-semialdehyde dehydrogenase [Anaerolineae bacterium]